MRIVVTGGAGFVGAHLTRVLSAAGCEVVVVDDLSTGARSNLDGLAVRLLVGSVTNRALMEEACTGADSIVHLAARPSVERSLLDPMATHDVNVTGTLTVLDVAQRAEIHVIVVSSSSVYGGSDGRPRVETDPPCPRSPYGASKLAAEAYAFAYQASFGLPVLVTRLFNVFGPYQSVRHAYAAVVPSFVDAALTGRPLTVHGDGRQTRDFTYVGTVAGILADAARRRLAYDRPVNLAFGTRTDLLAVIDRLGDILGRRLETVHTAPRAGDVRDSRADGTIMSSLFPAARAADLTDALAATVAWYQARLAELPTQRPAPPAGVRSPRR